MKLKRHIDLKEALICLGILALLGSIVIPILKRKSAVVYGATLNYKRVGAATLLYAADHEGYLPLAMSFNNVVKLWRFSSTTSVPEGWRPGLNAEPRVSEDGATFPNSARAYYRDPELTRIPGYPKLFQPGIVYSAALKPVQGVGMSFNGLLHNWSTSEVEMPSRSPLLWDGGVRANREGFAVATPALSCMLPDRPCRYNPDGDPQRTGMSIGGVMFNNPGSTSTGAEKSRFLSVDLTLTEQSGTSPASPGVSQWLSCQNGNATYPCIFRPDHKFDK